MSTSSSAPSMAGSDTTNSSSPTTSTTSSAPSIYKDSPTPPWIIYHLVKRAIPCDLPLRIMFSFNSGEKLPELRTIKLYWDNDEQCKLILDFFSSLKKITPSINDTRISRLQNPMEGPGEPNTSEDHAPEDRFMDFGNKELLDLDFGILDVPIKARKRIPAVKALGFVRMAFPQRFEDTKFEHGLTALDYLRDLEFTRREKMREAAERLNITLNTWQSVLAAYPDALRWIELVQKYELIIEAGYASIFIDLRIWKMVYELKSTPFYKPQVLAMLNTLFPPIVKELPNDRIQPKVLHQYRSSFYRYMTAVEANGPSVMDAFVRKLQMDGNRHSWRATWDNLRHYMDLAESMMKQAQVAIDQGIDMFVGGNYTSKSPLGLLDRELSRQSPRNSLALGRETNFDTSFEGGPSTTSRTLRMLSSKLPFRSHSRSRANGRNTTNSSPTGPPSLPKNDSFDSVSTTSTVVNTPGATPTTSFDGTATTSFSSTASDARRSIYAAHGIPLSAQNAVPPLPKLDTESIAQRHRTILKPLLLPSSPVLSANRAGAMYGRGRSDAMIPAQDRPKSSAGEMRTLRTDGNYEEDLPRLRGEKGMQDKRSIFDLQRPSTSHGEKGLSGKDADAKALAKPNAEKRLREKKGVIDLRRPSSSHGETSKARDRPLKQKSIEPELRPKTSYGEKDFDPRKPQTGVQSSSNSFKSMRAPVPIAKELKSPVGSPKRGPLPAPPNRASTFPTNGTERPRTSHGERSSQSVTFGNTVAKDFVRADRRIRKSPLSKVSFEDDILDGLGTTEVASVKEDRQANAKGVKTLGGKEKRISQWVEKQKNEGPAPLTELKRERTPSFYYSHMDSPSMPPPLSLGPKKPSDSREKPPPSPAASPSARKPVPSSVPVPSIRTPDLDVAEKLPAASLGRRMFARKPIPASDSNPKSPLPSDGLAFLSRPYEDMPVYTPPQPKKKPSITSLFQRENKAAKAEETFPGPETSGKPDGPKKPVSILKRSKSMQTLPKADLGDPESMPILKNKRSFGESLRAKFNIKSEESVSSDGPSSSQQVPKKKDNKPKPKPIQTMTYRPGERGYNFNNDYSDAAMIQRGELEVEIDGWKPSYMTKDQSVPRTPRGLDSPHFEESPEYVPGTVALPQREMIPQRKEDARRIAAQGGKYGQGQYVKGGDGYPEPEGSLMPELKKQLHIKAEHEKTSKDRFVEKYAKEQGIELDGIIRMNAVLKTTPEERMGPMIEEIKVLVAAAEKESIIVVEGNGEEDRPSPTDIVDRGDEKSYFDDEPGTPRRLRGSKSAGDLRNGNRNKLVKKKSIDEVRSGKSAKTPEISAPRPVVSLPDWDEKIEVVVSKEHTRKFLMEKAKADKRQWYLNTPSGDAVDRKLPKKKMRALSRVHKLESVKEESNLTIRGVSVLDASAIPKGANSSDDSDATVVPEPKPKPIVKKVRILSQATRAYDHEFEQPRATPKPPRVPEGRKMREDALLWTAEERERFREKEMERQKRGTLRMLFRGSTIEDNEEDWG